MAKILKFPDVPDKIQGQEILQDGDDLLRFESKEIAQGQDSGDTFSISDAFISSILEKAQAKDWTNQELADLFRVKHLLDAAGIPSDTDRGITDEGDPWFLFCDAAGDVFIHFCRIDGLYLLDSPNIAAPLRGRDFNELIENFTQRNLPVHDSAAETATHRVIRLKRNGKVLLHPSTMLAALISTLFLASEDLVMVVPDKSNESDRGLPADRSDTFSETGGNAFFEMQHSQHNAQADQVFSAESGHKAATNSGVQHLRDMLTASDTKFAFNHYATGLNVIAISLGFTSAMPGWDMDDSKATHLITLIAHDKPAEAYEFLEKVDLKEAYIPNFLAALENIFDTSPVEMNSETETAAADFSEMNEHLKANLFTGTNPDEMKAASVSVDTESQEQKKDLHKIRMDGNDAELSEKSPSMLGPIMSLTSASPDAIDSSSDEAYGIDILSTVFSHTSNMQDYVIGDTDVRSTFDVDATSVYENANLENVIQSASNTDTQKNFDDEAFKLISYLVDTNDDIEILSFENELVLFDLSVLKTASEDRFLTSWSLENGDTITMVGLQSDYDALSMMT